MWHYTLLIALLPIIHEGNKIYNLGMSESNTFIMLKKNLRYRTCMISALMFFSQYAKVKINLLAFLAILRRNFIIGEIAVITKANMSLFTIIINIYQNSEYNLDLH